MLCGRRRVVLNVAGFVVALAAMNLPSARAQATPKIEFLFPAGAQRGTEVEVQLGGDYMPGPCRLISAGDGLTVEPVEGTNRYRFRIADEATVGLREVRLSSVQGASSPFPFVVGDLPEVVQVESPQPLEITKLPVTANGRLETAGDIDEYAVTLAAGEQIVCAATTRSLRSSVDPMLRLLDAVGKPVAESFAHRSADALLTFRAPQAGRYVLQLFDFQMGGGADSVYRLTITTGPWLDYALPAGVSRDSETAVTVFGWNLPGPKGESHVVRVPPQSADAYELKLPGGANWLSLPVGKAAEITETEPNDVAAQAVVLTIPTTVNGRLQTPGDVDVFAFDAKQKEKIALELQSAELDFPTDGVLAIFDDKGKQLVELDDSKTSRDPSLRFTAPADGRYFVSLRDRSGGGGVEYVYRLQLSALRPELTARANAASLYVSTGQTVNLPVLVERVDGLADELEVTAEGMPAGVTVASVAVPAKTPGTVQLPFTAGDKIAPIAGLVRIVVRSKAAGATGERFARIAESAAATTTSESLWLAVGPEIPFTLKTSTTILDAPRLAGFPFPVSVTRKEGFTGPIRLIGVEPDRRGTLLPLEGEIAAGADEGTIPLVLQNKVTEGTTHRCRVMGVADVKGPDGKSYAVFHIAAGAMSVGCQPSLLTLTAEPTIIAWRPGGTQQIDVRLMRRTTMQPITLRLALPTGVTGIECEPLEVRGDQNQATLTLRFADAPPSVPRTTIRIEAESSQSGLPIYGMTSLRLEAR